MQQKSKRFPKHACQYFGTERKLVETIIDDEFCWNNNTHQYEPSTFTNLFEHTGSERCAECQKEWTGV